MLLFDWKKVYDTADGNIPACNTIMEMLINNKSLVTSLTVSINILIKILQVPAFFFMEICFCTIPISTHKKNCAYIML